MFVSVAAPASVAGPHSVVATHSVVAPHSVAAPHSASSSLARRYGTDPLKRKDQIQEESIYYSVDENSLDYQYKSSMLPTMRL